MPVIEDKLTEPSNSSVFAGLDFIQSYCQLLLHPSLSVCKSSIAHDGVFKTTSVLNGLVDAALHLQTFLSTNLPAFLCGRVLLCVKNCLFYESAIDHLFLAFCQIFEFCVKCNWS